MFVLIRALAYSTLFIALLLIFIPAQLLARAGIVRPAALGPSDALGLVAGAAGTAIAAWCILTFVFVGRGIQLPSTPASAGRAWPLPLCPQSDVLGRRTGTTGSRARLSVGVATRLLGDSRGHHASAGCMVRGADARPTVRRRLCLLPRAGESLAAVAAARQVRIVQPDYVGGRRRRAMLR